jgi:tetratricopeptide (TPR) repeat protein
MLLSGLYALLGQTQALSGETKNATSSLQKSRTFNAGSEEAYILEAMLEKDSDKKIAILQNAIVKADTIQRVRAELAMTYFYAGKYNEAIAQFDTCLPYIPEAFAELYLPFRNKAMEYKEAGIKPMQVISDTFTLEKMITIIHSETALLTWFTGPGKWESGVLFERMKGSGWFPENPLKPDLVVRRKDAALVFWYILTRGNSVKLRRYTEKYMTKAESPVADVPYGSPWFDAVLGVVEEDIMQLTEGKFFNPDAVLNELEFRKMLKLLSASA